jgi:hypothetical protein
MLQKLYDFFVFKQKNYNDLIAKQKKAQIQAQIWTDDTDYGFYVQFN